MPDEQHKYTYEPRLLRHADVERYIWGDDESGHVVDWYHRNSDKLIVSLFSLAPGARWTHSETHKSFYDADEGYYILQGSLTFHNPATGEVQVVNEGEALHFRRHTFHYGYNFGAEQVLIVAGFAPLPDDLTDAETLGSAAPQFDAPVGGRYDLLGGWPWNAAEAKETEVIKVLTRRDWLHVIQGVKTPVRVSLFGLDRAAHDGDVHAAARYGLRPRDAPGGRGHVRRRGRGPRLPAGEPAGLRHGRPGRHVRPRGHAPPLHQRGHRAGDHRLRGRAPVQVAWLRRRPKSSGPACPACMPTR